MAEPEIFESLPYLLAQAHRHVHGALDRVLKEESLPVEQWRILTVLADGEGRAMSDLSRQVLMNLPALSKTIDRMVSSALVHRKQDPEDSRRVLVFITDFGLDMVARCNARVGSLEKALSDKLGSWETERLCRLLKSLAD
jgi:DNA-binding MarR family transcriptional regulator